MSRQSVQTRSFNYPPPRPVYSSRTIYPSFLSLQDTLKLQLSCAWRGLLEAFRWDLVVSTVTSDSEIRSNVFKSLLLNSLSLTSIYAFDLLLQPLVRDKQKWLHRNVGWFYKTLWLLPVVGISLYLNSSWCSLIAKRTFVLQHGNRAANQQPVSYTGMLTMLATSVYRFVMVFTSVVISFALGTIPVVGPLAGFVFLCWVDAYYCFEFIWIARSMSLAKRVRHLEERWAYYFAFGLPSAALCMWGSSLANAAIFALMFPAYIIMAMHAHPVPLDPYNPLPPASSISSAHSNTEEMIRHPSPFIPIRVPIFGIVIWLNDWIVRIISVGGGGRGGARSVGKGRTMSDGFEKAEEGIELDAFAGRSGRGGGVERRKVD
ncbi:hypothetical protein PILCRDRAFT_822086 [Piloderma croceum F 1598]|uniref:EI24-domain-containing protein n=1 Tax=Piloderma croceum (strain F 1598) TaxID=765440 RepID=A0A0C3FNK1_PILCF|nr:hypothetical protein PILCRDRAFT_822086 [Piloderma croceum F 1598]